MVSRSKNVKLNIIYSFILKFLSIGLSFVLLPLTVNYLTEVEYGVWVTLFAAMNWVNFLDMGLGLGLRNKLAEAVSKNNLQDIKIYISTGIISISVMGMILLMLFYIGLNFVDMQIIFNTKEISEDDLYISTLFTGAFVILAFVLSIINQIYYAYQKAAVTGAIQIVHNAIMIIIVYYLTLQPEHKLFYFVLSFGIAILISRCFFIISFFIKNLSLMPKLQYLKIKYLKNIGNLGIQFFVIQLTCIVLFSSSNLLITQCLGPENVRAYDIVFKIFSIVTMAHSLILSPLWSAYTDAYVKKDYEWLSKAIKKLLYLMIPIILSIGIIFWQINFIIALWLKTDIALPTYLALFVGLHAIIYCWDNIWAIFVNGVGKVNIQLYSKVFSVIVILPLSWYLMKNIGVAGMALALAVGFFISSIPTMIQVRYILKNKI